MRDYTKIHGNKARSLYLKGLAVSLCPCKLSPWAFNNAFIIDLQATDEPRTISDWRRTIREFNWYNCNTAETGYNPSFWVGI